MTPSDRDAAAPPAPWAADAERQPEAEVAGQGARVEARLAVPLATVAGFVDAVGFLTLARLFTAHMSGNSVRLGVELGTGNPGSAVRYLVVVPLFMLGVAAGMLVVELARRRRARRVVALVLAPELALLGALMVVGELTTRRGVAPTDPAGRYYLLVTLVVLATGLQTSALRGVGGRAIRTTYVTGTLSRLAEHAVAAGFWYGDRRAELRAGGAHQALRCTWASPPLLRVRWLGRVWLAYLAGGVLGAFLGHRWALWALALPVAALAATAALDLLRPIATSGAPG